MYISALEEILRIRSIPIYFIPFNSSIPFILALYLDSEKSFLLNFRRIFEDIQLLLSYF